MRAESMLLTRRQWSSIATSGACAAFAASRATAAQNEAQGELERRIGRVVTEYERQGFHRTGTVVDRRSADWLYEQVRRIGLVPARESFALSRVDPVSAGLIVRGRRMKACRSLTGRSPTQMASAAGLARSAARRKLVSSKRLPIRQRRVHWARRVDSNGTRLSCV